MGDLNIETVETLSTNFDDFDDFLDLFKGRDQLSGTNVRYHTKLASKLKAQPNLTESDQEQLRDSFSQLGQDTNGNKKGKTCWDFVHNNKCGHISNSNDIINGENIQNRWHPSTQECDYLKTKLGCK